jgi:dTDP-4-dehydrorhamnose 3,5-epimerase
VGEVTQLDAIEGVVVVRPQPHGDERGVFREVFRAEWAGGSWLPRQVNLSTKSQGCVVGMHYHRRQADYWIPVRGRFQVVLCDIRVGSPTERNVLALDISGEDPACVFIPPGVAHGFATLTEGALMYLVDQYYDPADELGFSWQDPAVAEVWKVSDPIVSRRDAASPFLEGIKGEDLPAYGA